MNTEKELKRPRTKSPETRRADLMRAAVALFLSKGFDATSVDEIVAQADVSKGTFYLYFKTKDDVLQALQENFITKFREHLEAAVAKVAGDEWPVQLDAWVAAAVGYYLDAFALHDLVFHEFRGSRRHARTENPVTANLADLIAGGVKAGCWAVRSPQQSASMLFSAIHGAVDEEIISTARPGRKGLIAEVQVFCRRAIGLASQA